MFLEVLDIIIKTLDAQNIYCNKSINSQPQHKLQNLNLASYKHTHRYFKAAGNHKSNNKVVLL